MLSRPVPVFTEYQLKTQCRRSMNFHMGITPEGQCRTVAQIFIAQIKTTGKGGVAITDHQFAVVAEIQLHTGTQAQGIKARYPYPGFPQPLQVRPAQATAADFVIQQVVATPWRALLHNRSASCWPVRSSRRI